MVRGLVWGIFATLVVGSALGAALFLPPAPAQAPMKIWEAYARGYATIQQVDMTWEENGIIYTFPVGYTVTIKPEAGGNVVVDEPAMLMSPSPAQFGVDPNDPTTQDGALTTATIPNGSSLTYSYAEKWLQGYLPAPPWWCMEQYQYTHAGVDIVLGGEVLPFAIQDIIANPYFDSDTSNSQLDVWNYMKMHPTIVIGKTPLWKEIPNTAGEIVSVAISATNIAVKLDNDGIDATVDATGAIVRDIIPAGWTVVPGSYSIDPTAISDNPDGSKTVVWVVDIPAADVTGRTDFSKPTPYHGIKFRYQLESPQLQAGRIDLPRAEVDANHDETIDAHSAIPVLDVFSVNTAPTAALGGPITGVEGTSITFDASASSDSDGDALQYRWDFQSDGTWDTPYDASPISPPVTFGDDATGTVTVEVFDGELTAIATASYAIANAAPQILSVSISNADEGSPSTITVEFSDPGWLDTHTAFLDWGTGEMDTVALTSSHDPPAAVGTFTITHTYGDDFTYAGTLAIIDDDGGSVVQDLSVPVSNVAPTIGTLDVQLFVQAQVCLRVAGNSWNVVRMDLSQDNVLAGSVSITRTPGSPNDQAKCVPLDVDLLASHTYRADVTFEPKPGAKRGANSVWVLVIPEGAKINPGHALLKFHHVFHVGNPSTYLWKVDLPGLASKLIGGCGCDGEDDDRDDCGDDDDNCGDHDGKCGDSDDRDDGCEDDHDDGCGDSDDRDCDRGDDRKCGGSHDGCGDDDGRGGSRDGGDRDREGTCASSGDVTVRAGTLGACGREDGSGPDNRGACTGDDRKGGGDDKDRRGDDKDRDGHDGDGGRGSDDRCGEDDDHECGGSDKDCERDHDDGCGEEHGHDGEEDHEHDDDCGDEDNHDDGCGGVLIHIRVTATDPGTDDLTFTWTFPDGAVETHTFFNNGVSPDPRPSSLGLRPMTATDTVAHSLKQPCGKAVTLTVADDDGGVTTLVFTIQP